MILALTSIRRHRDLAPQPFSLKSLTKLQYVYIIIQHFDKDRMSTSSMAGLFGRSNPQPDEPPTTASQPTTTEAATRTTSDNSAPGKPNDDYYQDKDLNWWLTFARTFKSAVKTPLPDDDSDL